MDDNEPSLWEFGRTSSVQLKIVWDPGEDPPDKLRPCRPLSSSSCPHPILCTFAQFRQIEELNPTSVIPRPLSQTCQQPQAKEQWDLFAGVLVERLPGVSKSLASLEKEYKDFLEFEKSLKSGLELKLERDLIQTDLIKQGKIEIDVDDISAQTAQDLKDPCTEEFKKLKLAPRITEDDQKDNLNSVNRKLEDNLYLFVEQILGDKKVLALPQGKRKEGETMRQTAERVLKETCGESMKVCFFENTPCGLYKYKYPGNVRNDNAVGAKVFFFRGTLQKGNVDEKVAQKYEWLDKSNMERKLKGSYGDVIQKLLL